MSRQAASPYPQRPRLREQFLVQCRVIRALFIREGVAHFGRSGLGFLWVIVEPLTFVLPVLILWDAVRAPYEHGTPIMPLLWTGYMPLQLFRHIGGRMLFFVRHNVGLMYHRNVTLLDIFVARCSLEVVQNILSGLVAYLFFYALGKLDAPRDFSMLVLGYLFMIWWCVVVGLLIGALCERAEWIAKAWHPIAYTYIFYSGTFYMANWLPPKLREIALCMPSLQAYEMIRAGVLSNSIVTHYSIGYTTLVLLALTLLGLASLRSGRALVSMH